MIPNQKFYVIKSKKSCWDRKRITWERQRFPYKPVKSK